MRHLKLLSKKESKCHQLLCHLLAFAFLRQETLGKSIGGLDIPLLKIGNVDEETERHSENKPVIVVIGRQHSGETHSSFVIHGLIN